MTKEHKITKEQFIETMVKIYDMNEAGRIDFEFDLDRLLTEERKKFLKDATKATFTIMELEDKIKAEREKCIKKLEPLDKEYSCGCYAVAIEAIRED